MSRSNTLSPTCTSIRVLWDCFTFTYNFGTGVTNTRTAGRMRPSSTSYTVLELSYFDCRLRPAPRLNKSFDFLVIYLPVILFSGRAMAQVVSRWPLIAETRVRARVNPCGICCGQSGTGTGFSPSSSGFPCQYIIPLSLSKLISSGECVIC
jgi:hypothetical protein